jgi:GNAT superfamily N-acetyltransferase
LRRSVQPGFLEGMTLVQPRQLTISPLDPADGATLRAWHEVACRCHEADLPSHPLPTYRESVVHASEPTGGYQMESYVARDGERLAGALLIQFPLKDNQHVADAELWVDPLMRRAGVGRALYNHAVERARAAGRSLLLGEVMRGAAGEEFVAAMGGELRLATARRLLWLDTLDRAWLADLRAEAQRHAVGYSLVGWAGAAPDEHIEGVATVMASMNDAPVDDLDVDDEVWDAARLREMERRARDRGGHRRMLLARHDATGDYAGLTEILVRGGPPVAQASQGATVVVPAHRGHRLGLLLKTAMLEAVLAEEPGVRRIETWNADSNGPMLAINERLGFRAVERWSECQAAISTGE